MTDRDASIELKALATAATLGFYTTDDTPFDIVDKLEDDDNLLLKLIINIINTPDLGRVPVFTIMLTGRWRSTAFLVYIRKQNNNKKR